MINVLRLFQKALICRNRIISTLVMEEKVYFSMRGSRFRPRPGTPRLRIRNSGPCYWCLDTNEASCKIQLSRCNSGQKIGDRRTDDITILVEHIFQKCALIKSGSVKGRYSIKVSNFGSGHDSVFLARSVAPPPRCNWVCFQALLT
jgi:hypothetical protein